MKIYVITKGSYSDYHICAVADNKKRAKELQKFFCQGEGYEIPSIETFDTEEYTDVFDRGFKVYTCFVRDGLIYVNEREDNDYPTTKIERWKDNSYRLDVVAKDKEHAQKIFTDKVAEYKARYKLV